MLSLLEGVALPDSHCGMLGASVRMQECHCVWMSAVEQHLVSLHWDNECHEEKGSTGLLHEEE